MKLDKNNFALRIIDINAGWMLVEYEINGKTYTFDISSAIGDPFECLLEVAYYFNGNNHDPLEEDWTGYGKHYSYFRYFDDNGNEFYLDDLPPEEEKAYWEEHHSIAEGPLRMKFSWNSEPQECDWTIERLSKYDLDESCLRITICDEESITFDIEYRDFCYAVVKAYNDMLMKTGFIGFHYGSYYYQISVHKFLYLKALILGKNDLIEFKETGPNMGRVTDIRKEMQLLLMEM